VNALRLGLLTIALAACVWFALGVRAAHDTGRAQAILSRQTSLTPAQTHAALSAIAAARTLNPDQGLNILRAQVQLHSGHRYSALAIAKGIVRREPENVDAWLNLALMSGRIDPAANRLAHVRIQQLVSPARPAT